MWADTLLYYTVTFGRPKQGRNNKAQPVCHGHVLFTNGADTVHFMATPKPDQNLTEQLAALLAEEDDLSINLILIDKDLYPERVLRRLAKADNIGLRQTIAGQKNCPAALIEKLAEDKEGEVREEVASNPAAPEALVEELFHDPDFNVAFAAMKNPTVSTETLEKLIQNLPNLFPGAEKAIVSNPNCPGWFLQEKHVNDLDCHPGIAINPNTPENILQNLAKSEFWDVRWGVTQNPSCPGWLLKQLAEDENPAVGLWVVTNPTCSAELLDKKAECSTAWVWKKIAAHPNVSEQTLQKLAVNDNYTVRMEVAKQRNMSEQTRQILQKDQNWHVRQTLETNCSVEQRNTKFAVQTLNKTELLDNQIDVLFALADKTQMLVENNNPVDVGALYEHLGGLLENTTGTTYSELYEKVLHMLYDHALNYLNTKQIDTSAVSVAQKLYLEKRAEDKNWKKPAPLKPTVLTSAKKAQNSATSKQKNTVFIKP